MTTIANIAQFNALDDENNEDLLRAGVCTLLTTSNPEQAFQMHLHAGTTHGMWCCAPWTVLRTLDSVAQTAIRTDAAVDPQPCRPTSVLSSNIPLLTA